MRRNLSIFTPPPGLTSVAREGLLIVAMLFGSAVFCVAAEWNPALNNDGSLAGDTTVTLTNNETVTVANAISGSYSLTVSGAGTLELQKANTYTGATTISGGAILKLSTTTFNLTKSSQVDIGKDSVLELAVGNALGYVGNDDILTTINMGDASKIVNSVTDNHSNLGNITVTGTGAQIVGNGEGSSGYGNFLLAGKITLRDNTSLTMDVNKLTIRRKDASLKDDQGNSLSGILDVGTGAVLTMGSSERLATVNVYDSSAYPHQATITKTGAGTLTIHGNLVGRTSETSSFIHQAGISNLNGKVENLAISVTGGTVNAKGGVTGTSSLQVAGGTLVLSGTAANTFTGATNVSNGGTLKLASTNALNSATAVTVDGGTLEMAAANAISYKNTGFVENITLKKGGTIHNSAVGNHQNLGNLQVSGTGNVITAATGAGSTDYGEYLLAGKITLEKDTDLTITAKKVTLRGSNAGLGDSSQRIFDVGENAFLTAHIETVSMLDMAHNQYGDLVKQGAGTMIVNGTISGAGNVRIEEGLLTLSGDQNYTGGTTIQDNGMLGIGEKLTLTNNVTVETGGRIAIDFSNAGNDLLSIDGSLKLAEGAFLELNFLDAVEVGSGVEFLQADEFLNGLGEVIALWSDYIVGLPGNYVVLQLGNALAVADRAYVPEPSTWGMLLLGWILGFWNWRKKQVV
ncbi:MAG: autotransporter-associated beta strand repeat-containing protein [Planctomycetia bacterium]|nr:autotransporter-associated beta strand repeat-containing protein [Planctomycetia bacterium]